MKKPAKPVNEPVLRSSLNEQAHAFARELAMTCKKIAIYGSSHPVSARAMEKPFLLLDKICVAKRYVSLNLQAGYLYALNIRLKESTFTADLIRYMQILDVIFKASSTILFGSSSVCSESAFAAAWAKGPPEPIEAMPSSGSMTSPLPDNMNE